jgi:hypothetical protein
MISEKNLIASIINVEDKISEELKESWKLSPNKTWENIQQTEDEYATIADKRENCD